MVFLLSSLSGCAVTEGVSKGYSGLKTFGSDSLAGLGKILSGGDITISIKTNAAYNDKTEKTVVEDGGVEEDG